MKKILIVLLSVLLAFAGCTSQEAPASEPVQESSAESMPESSSQPEPASESEPESSEEASPPEPVEPEVDNSWELDAPENHGMDPELLAAMHEAVADTPIYSIVTAKDGVIVDEYYAEEYDENSIFRFNSCSKSFTSALVGLAIEQGYISGVDARLGDYLPAVDELENTIFHQITLEQLLTQTSGIEWYEWGGGNSNFFEWRESGDWVGYILNRQIVADPGTYFAYSTGNTHLLAAALQNATGKSAYEYGLENIFTPLGMDSVEWEADDQGVTDGGNGISMTARDAAKFGQLYLNNGSWKGEQIVPAAWVETSTSTQTPGPGGRSGSYGYQWWVRPFGEGNYDAYYAMGAFGQFIFVVPELELVTVVTGQNQSDTYAPMTYFSDYILASVSV